MTGARTIGMPGSTGPLGKEYRQIANTMTRCTRHVRDFDAKAYDATAVEKARALWKVRLYSEYTSTAVFSSLAAQLMEARASIEATTVVLRMSQDELRHGEVCGEAISALGGNPAIDEPFALPVMERYKDCSIEESALRNVIFGCALTEVVNTARFVDSLDTMSDPFLSDIVRQLLSDEVLHGQFGFLYLAEWSDWLDAHPDVRRSIGRYLPIAFATLEQKRSGVGGAPKVLTEDERALGLPDPARLPETFYATVEGAIIPGLARFGLDAARAWRERPRLSVV